MANSDNNNENSIDDDLGVDEAVDAYLALTDDDGTDGDSTDNSDEGENADDDEVPDSPVNLEVDEAQSTDKTDDADNTGDDKDELAENDEMIEFEVEGGEVQSGKLSDLIESHLSLSALQQENAELKSNADVMPAEINQVIGQLQNQLEENAFFANMLAQQGVGNLTEPDLRLADPDSEMHDPEKYFQLSSAYKAAQGRGLDMEKNIEDMKTQYQKYTQTLQENLQAEQANLRTAENAKTAQFWPELMDNKDGAYEGVVDMLRDDYGFKDAEALSIVDSRQFKLIKDLMAYKAADKKRSSGLKKATKILRNSPRILPRGAKASVRKNKAITPNKSMTEDEAVEYLSS